MHVTRINRATALHSRTGVWVEGERTEPVWSWWRQVMSSAAESKDGQPAVSKVESKSRLGRGVSAPSSPRTPSPAASLLTIGSETVTDKSCKGGDEASFSGAHEGPLEGVLVCTSANVILLGLLSKAASMQRR